MTWSARTPMGTLSVDTARPVSDDHASGNAHDITVKRSGLPRPSTLPKSSWRPEGPRHENADTRTGLSRRRRHRRPGVGLYLSHAVGAEEGRVSPRDHRQAGTGGASGR